MAIRYVEENPCRAGIVARAEDYRWSSAGPHLGGVPDRTGILDMQYWKRAGGVDTWRELHGQPLPPEEVSRLRKCTYSGRPFGGETFLQEMEERFQRRWTRRGTAAESRLAKSA
jgi:putative transposase